MNDNRIVTAALAGLIALGGARSGWAVERDGAWIERRVETLQPSAEERRIDQIGWASDIRAAERLAAKQKRPVFLFTMDGRFSIGRC
ncbi:MAG: hypothetical protein NVSMB9_16620 [Isosphaeraceae bacterium]